MPTKICSIIYKAFEPPPFKFEMPNNAVTYNEDTIEKYGHNLDTTLQHSSKGT